jgi:rubrerythrin
MGYTPKLSTDWEMWKRFDERTFKPSQEEYFQTLALGGIKATIGMAGKAEDKVRRIEMIIKAMEEAEAKSNMAFCPKCNIHREGWHDCPICEAIMEPGK